MLHNEFVKLLGQLACLSKQQRTQMQRPGQPTSAFINTLLLYFGLMPALSSACSTTLRPWGYNTMDWRACVVIPAPGPAMH
jgi:hypothetical protein